MTEEEARLRWCPFARVGGGRDAGMATVNRPHYTSDSFTKDRTRCYASDCMAWRWTKRPVAARGAGYDLNGSIRRSIPAAPAEPGQGFCGLAGAPQ